MVALVATTVRPTMPEKTKLVIGVRVNSALSSSTSFPAPIAAQPEESTRAETTKDRLVATKASDTPSHADQESRSSAR